MMIKLACMPPEREIREKLARCVSTLVFYKADGCSWSGAQLLFEEARLLSHWSYRFDSENGIREVILDPLERELSLRYGAEEGGKLCREFQSAFQVVVDQGAEVKRAEPDHDPRRPVRPAYAKGRARS